MLIQVDVDSTLYDADKLFGKVAKTYGVNWKYKSPWWYGPKDINTDLATLKKVFRTAHSREFVSLNKPYKGAVECLTDIALEFDAVEIAYVSDRNEQQTGALEEWLEAKGFLTDDCQVMTTKDKRHWMREKRPEIVIDDRVRTLLMARYELNAYGVSLEHAHNVNLKGEVDRVFILPNWAAIHDTLREIIPTLIKVI